MPRLSTNPLGRFLAACTVLLLLATPAAAAPGAWAQIGDTNNHGTMLNAFAWNNGEFVAWCNKDTQGGPATTSGYNTHPSVIYRQRTIGLGEVFTPGRTHGNAGPEDRVSAAHSGPTAYLVWKGSQHVRHIASNLGGSARQWDDETRAYHYGINGLSEGGTFRAQEGAPQSVKNRAAQFRGEALTHGGPYTATQPDVILGNGGRDGTINNLGVKGRTGTYLAGYKWTATIRPIEGGSAIWTDTGTPTLTGTSTGGPQSFKYKSTGNGKVRVHITFTMPPTSYIVNESPRSQDTFSEGPMTTASAEGDPFTTQIDFQPALTTTVVNEYVKPGDILTDRLEATTTKGLWVPGIKVTFKGTLYGPYPTPQPQTPTPPTNAPTIGTTTLTVDRPGTHTSQGFPAPTTGYYTWVWTMTKNEQPQDSQKLITADWADPFFKKTETSSARHTPKVDTQILTPKTLPNDPIRDTITPTGFQPDHGRHQPATGWPGDNTTLHHTIYGPFNTPPHETNNPINLETAPTVATIETNQTTTPHEAIFNKTNTPKTPGHYVIVTRYSGDGRHAPFTTSPYDKNEQFQVAPKPEVTTQAQPETFIGLPFSDTAEIKDPEGIITTGTGYKWELTFRAYGPHKPDETPTCDGTPHHTDTQTVTKPGTYKSGQTTVNKEGNMYWVETLTRTPIDGTGTPSGEPETIHQGACGIPNETTKVHPKPGIVTKATPTIRVGEVAEDTATVTDPNKALTLGGYKWFAVFEAYGPTTSPTCEGTPLYKSGNIPVTQVGEVKSGPTSPIMAAGNLYWVETLYAVPVDKDRVPTGEPVKVHQGECGIPDETTIVTARGGGNAGKGGLPRVSQ